MSETNLELLVRYSRQNTEEAFAELVRRHLDVVYSVALRQVRSPQLAEEVAQSGPSTRMLEWGCKEFFFIRREVLRKNSVGARRRKDIAYEHRWTGISFTANSAWSANLQPGESGSNQGSVAR